MIKPILHIVNVFFARLAEDLVKNRDSWVLVPLLLSETFLVVHQLRKHPLFESAIVN